MKLLLKQVTIQDPSSPHHLSVKDILVIDGTIQTVGNNLKHSGAQIIEINGLEVSPGWVDIFSHFNDPGYEYKETLETGAASAAAGGYTRVFILPNTSPAITTKAAVEYIVQGSRDLPIYFAPLGAVSKNIEGKELAEMYDMRNSGAVAFSDGLHPVQTPGLLLKALQYVKAFDGVVVQMPLDRSIGKGGLMNEGITSTQLGLPGVPAISEELMICRDIELAKYSGSKLHITGITTARSLDLISQAKKQGVNVTCSVTPYHLVFCDEDLRSYDTNLKVEPPLRSRADMMALRQGVVDDTVDCIASHHLPQDWDHKICEFEYAAPGMSSLQTAFAVVNDVLPELSTERLVELFSSNPRRIFSLAEPGLKEGAKAELTLFNRKASSLLTLDNNKGKSRNTPFLNREMKGKVVGIIAKDRLYLNP